MTAKRPGILKILGLIFLFSALVEAIVVCVILSNPQWRKLATDWVTHPERETRKVARTADNQHWDEKLFDFNISNYPESPDVYLQRAQFRNIKGKYKEAIEDCDRAKSLCIKTESGESAVTAVLKPISKKVLLGLIYAEKAHAEVHLKKLHEATADYKAAIESGDTATRVYTSLADCCMQMDDAPGAIACCTQGLEHNSDSQYLYSWRAYAYEHNEETEQALADVNKAIEIAPDVADYYDQKCRLLLGHDNEQALAAVNQAIKLKPDRILGYDWKICILINQKNYDEALRVADQGLQIKPHSQRLKALRENIIDHQKTDRRP